MASSRPRTSRTDTTTVANGHVSGPNEPVDCNKRTIPWTQVFPYGVGHFYNDLCASMWFSYMLLFLKNVLLFSSSGAGIVILIGQITDGLATPLVGIEADQRRFKWLVRYGQRKSWHAIGTIFVTVSFPFLFMNCLQCHDTTVEYAKLIYFIPFVVIFQIGWATVQISHLALIPDLSNTQRDRTTLNGLRYGFTVIANLSIFALAWLLFGMDTTHTRDVMPCDAPKFRIMAFATVAAGLVLSLVFHFGTNEKKRIPPPCQEKNRPPTTSSTAKIEHISGVSNTDESSDAETVSVNSMDEWVAGRPRARKWRDWFKEFRFYQMGLLYVCTRLFVNISQVYMPLYLLETQHFDKEYIAIVPLMTYASSFVVSLLFSSKWCHFFLVKRDIMYIMGAVFGMGACAWMWFHNLQEKIFGVAIFIGIASAILLITSLSMVSDMIGPHLKSGAFVFGAMSFCDKLGNGIAIQFIQSFEPQCSAGCNLKANYYRDVMAFVPGCALVLGLLALGLGLALTTANGRRIAARDIRENHAVSS